MYILAAISLGFLGSFHCIGMCGPIALSIPVRGSSPFYAFTGSLLYNAGRMMTYAFMGLLFGLLGQSFRMAGMQNILSVALGVLILAILFIPTLVRLNFHQPKADWKIASRIKNPDNLFVRTNPESAIGGEGSQDLPRRLASFPFIVSKAILWGKYLLFSIIPIRSGFLFNLLERLKLKMHKLFGTYSMKSLFVIGLLNGLLPCGLVYLGIAGSIATGDAVRGSLFMMGFGLGTFPAMMALTMARNSINIRFRERIRKVVPIFAGIMAVMLIIRGLNLGIPYLSPSIETNRGVQVQKCCDH